jgi:hypothetical protein
LPKEVEMNNVRLILPIAVILLLACLIAPPATAKSYPMVCKGGGEMVANFSHVKGRGGFHSTSLSIDFKKSPAAASVREPAPGHCAWVDRAVTAEEPSSLAYSPGSGQDFFFEFKGSSWRLTRTEDSGLEQIMDAVRGGEKFYIRCHRQGTFFKVDSVGP